MLHRYRRHGCYVLETVAYADGLTLYELRNVCPTKHSPVVLAFSITPKGYLIGDRRDPQTARRAMAHTSDWW